jgi:hypothetical protein
MAVGNNKKTTKRRQGFQPGKSGNPSGRPKKNRDLERLIRDALDGGDGINHAVSVLLHRAYGGKPKDSTEAIKLLLAYGYGKPKQSVAVTGDIKTALIAEIVYVNPGDAKS